MKLEMQAPLGIQVPIQGYPDYFREAQKAFWETEVGRAVVGSHIEFGGVSMMSRGSLMDIESIKVTVSTEMRFKEPIEEEELVRLMLKFNGRLIDDE